MADPIGGDGEAIFHKGDGPADAYGGEHGCSGKFQMAIPRHGHKDIRDDEQKDRRDLGRGEQYESPE